MSHSTFVKVSIAMTAIEFTFGSRELAEVLGVGVRQPLVKRGAEARPFITQTLHAHLPEFEYGLVKQVLDRHDAEYSAEDRVHYERVYNQLQVTVMHFD